MLAHKLVPYWQAVVLLLFYALLRDKVPFCCSTSKEGAHKQNVFLLSMLSVEIRFSEEKVVARDKL